MDRAAIDDVMLDQGGVISRRQIMAAGGADADIARMVRRRELVRVHGGVFVGHTGPLAQLERSWAAVLFFWPAALCHHTALEAMAGQGKPSGDVHVAIDTHRRVTRLPGVVVHRVKDFDSVALMNLSPPRVRIEQAALEVASSAASDVRRWPCWRTLVSPGARPLLGFWSVSMSCHDSGAVGCCARSWQTSRVAPTRSWSGCTCVTSSDRTGCPRVSGSETCGQAGRAPSVTSSTWTSDWWSSSMVGSGTSGQPIAGRTSTVTSVLRWTVGSRSGSVTDRCSSPAASPRR